MTPTVEVIRNALKGVIDPELGDNVVDLGMVRNVTSNEDGSVVIDFALTVASCPLRTQLREDIERHVGQVPGVTKIEINTSEMDTEEKSALMQRARWKAREEIKTDIPMNTRIIAIASGKGGVGKSSVTANVAAALAMRGLTVGVLDADIWGFSIPRMLGIDGELLVENKKMIPLRRELGDGQLKVLSMGFLSNENEAIMWRGLILNRAVQHFLEDVQWGDLDYLLIDMPPGTGDIQMGLARMLPRTEMIVVTTPALAAQQVAARAADMARRGFMRIAGVIENMSASVNEKGELFSVFGEGGGKRLADEIGVPLIGTIPLDPRVAGGGDSGEPAVMNDGPASEAIRAIVERLVSDIVPPIELAGCTARMMDAIDVALTKSDVANS